MYWSDLEAFFSMIKIFYPLFIVAIGLVILSYLGTHYPRISREFHRKNCQCKFCQPQQFLKNGSEKRSNE